MVDPEVLDKIKRACSPQKAIYDIANYVETDVIPPINEATDTANAAAAQANSAYNRATDALNTANGVAEDVSRSLIDLNASGDGSTVTLNAPRNTGNPATAPLPVADATKAGVMNSATYVNLQNLNTRVSSLENQTTTYIVSFTNDNPTQDEINNAYKTAYPTAPFPPIDGTTVIDSTRQLYYRWVKNGAIWLKTTGFVISQFTNETAGTIKGSTTAGQIQAETDGTGSLVGYDQIKNDITANATGITTLTTNLAATNSDIATLRTTVNSNTSKANLAINTINTSADASNAKVGYVKNNGIQETVNLPVVSSSQAGVVTPTMFNAWNKEEEVIKYTTYNKFSWGSAANFTGYFRINNYLFTARSFHSSGQTTLVIDGSVDDNFEVNTMQYIGPNDSPQGSYSTSSLHYIGRLPGNTTLIGASTSSGNYRSYAGIVFINHLDSNMNVDAKAVILLSSYYPSSNRDIQVEIWTSANWPVELVATGGGPSVS